MIINKTIEVSLDKDVNSKEKDDEMAIIKILRVNPNGTYGNYVLERGITNEQRIEIEKILGIALENYEYKL